MLKIPTNGLEMLNCGSVVYLSFPSKFHQACIDISAQYSSSDNDLAILLEKNYGTLC